MKRVPDELLEFARRLADASGPILRQSFRTAVGIDIKLDRSPVTEIDRKVEETIRRLISETYPHHGVIGEEYGADRPDAEFVWVIDPIDGTKSFVTGRPLFGTLIGLACEGHPVLGIIDHPALGTGERWDGAVGHPTRMNGTPVRTRHCPDPADAALFASSPHSFRNDRSRGFLRVSRAARQVLYSSDCYAYGLLAAGFADVIVDAGLGIYDYIAAVAVIEGAGGVITDWHGDPLTLASGDSLVAAGDPRLHERVLEMLAGE